ncbi:hypothetical protein HAX54_032791, partial [Datura stramonium]|nr:hypothetical protein [Datura stramonium]
MPVNVGAIIKDVLSEHSRALYKVGLGFEEPLDDDVATDDEMTRVDSNIESDDDDDEDSEKGKLLLHPLMMN